MSLSKDKLLDWPMYPIGSHAAPAKVEESKDAPVLTMEDEEFEIVVFDTETTGMSRAARIVEYAAARVRFPSGKVVARIFQLVNPEMTIPRDVIDVHHITDEMVKDSPTAKAALQAFMHFVGRGPLVAHNASFDHRILVEELARVNLARPGIEIYDSIFAAKRVLTKKGTPDFKLETLIKVLGVNGRNAHRAMADVLALTGVITALFARSTGKALGDIFGKPLQL